MVAIARPLSRQERRRRLTVPLRVATAVGIVALWQLAALAVDQELLLPGPLAVLRSAGDLIVQGTLPSAVLQSLLHLLGGMAIAASIGTTLGAMSGLWRPFGDVVGPLVRIVYVVPTVAVLPIVIIWFGIFESARLVLIAYSCFFEFFTFTRLGVERAYQQYAQPAASMGAQRARLITRVLLPGSVPYLSTGARLATAQAIVGLVLAEFFTAISSERDGIGAIILVFQARNDTAYVFVGILSLMLLSVGTLAVLRAVERRFARWHLATRAAG